MQKIKLEKNWLEVLKPEFEKEYMRNLKSFLQSEKKQGKVIFPQGDEIFSALNLSPLDKTKVVIIGQDPYHGIGQAHGLCFSVKPGVRIPPSLRNVYKEMQNDLGITTPNHGHLAHWAEQGVLMLNNVLSVEQGNAGSHRKKGWEIFTDRIVDILNTQKEGLVFLLWGRDAQSKCAQIDRKRHLVLEAAHPSPLAGNRFLGNRHFSKTNEYLASQGKGIINWELPSL